MTEHTDMAAEDTSTVSDRTHLQSVTEHTDMAAEDTSTVSDRTHRHGSRGHIYSQ